MCIRDRGATLYLPETTAPLLPEGAIGRHGLGLTEISPALSFGLTLGAAGLTTALAIAPRWIRARRLSY